MSYIKVVLCCLATGQHTVKTVTQGTEQAYLGLVHLGGQWYRGWVNHIQKDDKGCYFVEEDYYTFVFTPAELASMKDAYYGQPVISAIMLKLRSRNIMRANGELTVLGKRILETILIFDKTNKTY